MVPVSASPRSAAPVREPGPDPYDTPDATVAARLRVPAAPRTHVRRQRLADLLTAGVQRPLTLVTGPAGAGKTVAAADWAHTAGCMPVAWLTLEADDNDPRVFWSHFASAVGARAGAVAPHGDLGGEVGRAPGGLLATALARLGPSAIVLDEFDRITGATEVAEGLHDLLRHACGALRVILVGRNEPPLPLHRYRAAGDIGEIRAADLAFTPDETAALLCRHGLELSDTAVHALAERTGGWAAGLRLCALAAEHADDPEAYLEEFEAGHSVVADFLLAEVLDTQQPEVQDVLLRTSILDRTHPDLADALTGRRDAERILDELAHANAFVAPVGGSWYRHNPLFAEILRAHLRVRTPGLTEELHGRAALWLRDAGFPEEALRHAGSAGRWDLAATWVVDDLALDRFLTGPGSRQLVALFDALPKAPRGSDAELVCAAMALAAHDAASALNHLEDAARTDAALWTADPQQEPFARAPHESAATHAAAAVRRLGYECLRAVAGRMTGSATLAEDATRAAEGLRPLGRDRLRRRQRELTALAHRELGAARLWEGRIDAARTELRYAATETPDPRQESTSLLALADLLGGAPGRAEAHARQALADAECRDLPPTDVSGFAFLVLAEAAAERNELALSVRYLARPEVIRRAEVDPLAALLLATLRSKLALCKGDSRGALAAAQDTELPPGVERLSAWATRRTALAVSAALLGQGDPGAALGVLAAGDGSEAERAVADARARIAGGDAETARRRLSGVPVSAEAPAIAARVLLAKAEATELGGDHRAAEQMLARAFALARPDCLRRPVLDAGPWLPRFMRRHPSLVTGHDWLPESLRPRKRDRAADRTPTESLSDREHDVLERVAQMMSTEEVAADLHLSANTVKTHLKSIHRKLGVARRAEAVRRARRLGIL